MYQNLFTCSEACVMLVVLSILMQLELIALFRKRCNQFSSSCSL